LFITLGLIFSLVLLEAALQTGALILSLSKNYGNRHTAGKEGAYKILCLGESTTDGQYPWQLQEVLNSRNSGVQFRVIDKGEGGTSTDSMIRRLNSYLEEYKTDMVVAMIGVNDNREDLTVYDYAQGPWYEIFRSYRFFKLLKFHISAKINGNAGKNSKDAEAVRGTITEPIYPAKKDVVALLTAARSFRGQERYKEAEEMFREAISLDPGNAGTYTELGDMYRFQQKYIEAEAACLKAIGLKPGDDLACAVLGYIYGEQKRYGEAELMCRKAVDINPKNNWAYIELGNVYGQQKKYTEAEAAFRKVIANDPRNGPAYTKLGEMFGKQEKFRDAEEMYLAAIKINPENDWALERLGDIYRRQKRFREAAEMSAALTPPERNSDEREGPKVRVRVLHKDEIKFNKYYGAKTQYNYRKLREVFKARNIKLVCVQYPARDVQSLKVLLEPNDGITFVDNDESFKNAVDRDGYDAYFIDRFAGDFGHCTEKGNRLLAENIAEAVIRGRISR